MFLMLSNYSNKNILGMNLNNLIFILEMSIRTLLIIITTIIMDLIQKKIKLSLIHRNKKISYLLLNPRMRKNMSSFFSEKECNTLLTFIIFLFLTISFMFPTRKKIKTSFTSLMLSKIRRPMVVIGPMKMVVENSAEESVMKYNHILIILYKKLNHLTLKVSFLNYSKNILNTLLLLLKNKD